MDITMEELQVKYAELLKTNQANEAKIVELENSNKTLASEKEDLQKTNNKLFMMIDSPAPQDKDDVDEPAPQINLEEELLKALN